MPEVYEIRRKDHLTAGTLLSVLIVLGVLTGLNYQRDLSSSRQKLEGLGSQVVDTKCGPVEVDRAGSGDPVLAIRGIRIPFFFENISSKEKK